MMLWFAVVVASSKFVDELGGLEQKTSCFDKLWFTLASVFER
jgi:hypothetical protein